MVYAPLAPRSAGSAANGQVSLKLSLRNNGSGAVRVNQVRVSFIGTPAVSPVTIPLSLDIAKGATRSWFFEASQNILVPVPAPASIRVAISCDGFDTPASVILPLGPHKSPTPAGSYRFPARARDLRKGEYWSGLSTTHASAGDGGQLFGYDLVVVAWDATILQWSEVLPGKAGDKNEHYRIWGKPIYAMAAGTVVAFANDRPTNPKPGEDLSPPDPVEGNHFYIQQGDELVLYAHLQKGSLNSSLLSIGAAVQAGAFLGLAGNSGNSTGPHLHIHSIQATAPWAGPLRPLPFNGLHVIDRTAIKPPDPAGPWVNADDQALPSVRSAIWPEPTAPTWYPPGWGEVARHGIPQSQYQVEFERISKSGYRPVWVDGYDVNGETFFNVIFRPNDGTGWAARHGLTSDAYQSVFNTFTAQGFRLVHIESYLAGGGIRYAPIFVRSTGPAFVAYHGRTADDHQQQFNDVTADGFRPINISAVSIDGQRSYAALYEKRDVGSFFAKSFVTPAEYQTHFDQNAAAGRRLVYLGAYTHNGSPRISAIWHQKPQVSLVARHGLTSGQYQAEFDARLAAGFLTRAVAGYEEARSHRFAAFWTK
ncbi:MAG: peptidoglycan DD-metalloendopeptidase family protein [Actinomycetota bacterium]|nr:peptidoglycan DD-metalloendopeptidase family protein [Actinomycetota bacterium]